MNKKIEIEATSKTRLRYAPSPTGYLHIGNARTALFNYLFTKHNEGSFIIRIEDTDINRNVKGAIESQFNDLHWLGIKEDESFIYPKKYGPYRQLQRLHIYQKYASELINQKKAYYCFCSTEEINEQRKNQKNKKQKSFKYNQNCRKLDQIKIKHYLKENKSYNIRLITPVNKIYSFVDLVRGEVNFNTDDIGDWIIMKSNKIPTYNFAVVIDDHLMEISHIIRGEEHISNTPKQQILYQYFNWKEPIFAHLSLIVNEDRKKLSKRDDNIIQYISEYRKKGYLPNALINFLALLGWSPLGEKEVFSIKELIKIFDYQRLSKSSSMFDVKKLQWLNNYYLNQLSIDDYCSFIKTFLNEKSDLTKYSNEWVNQVILIYRSELNYGAQIINLSQWLFDKKFCITNDLIKDLKEFNITIEFIEQFSNKIKNITEWNKENIKFEIKKIGKEFSFKGKQLFMPIRLLVTYNNHGPDLISLIYLLEKKTILKNLDVIKNELAK